MKFSFREKALIVSLLASLLVFGAYFIDTGLLVLSGQTKSTDVRSLIRLLVLVFVLEAVVYGLIKSGTHTEAKDERDRLFTRLSYRNAYWCMCIGVWFIIGHAFVVAVDKPNSSEILEMTIQPQILLSPYVLANLLLFLFVISEVVMLITQLYYYRKSAA